MDFFKVIKKRRTIRNYKRKKIPLLLIKRIINAGINAPSAMNKQPWRFVVINDPKIKEKIRKIYEKARRELNYYKQNTSFVKNGTTILVCSESKIRAMQYSCAMASENMLLAATALNLGSGVIIAPFQTKTREKEMRKLLKIPPALVPLLLITIGYTGSEKSKKTDPKKLNLVVYKDRFGNEKRYNIQ